MAGQKARVAVCAPWVWVVTLCLGWAACAGGTPRAASDPARAPRLPDGGAAPLDAASVGGCDDGGACDPCEGVVCPLGMACAPEAGGGVTCQPQRCDQLACPAPTRCQPLPEGAGAVCHDPRCEDDQDCAPEAHCGADGLCAEDVCEPGARRCDGAAVARCADNGGAWLPVQRCEGAGGFMSACVEELGDARCTCQADWDCPAFTRCQVDRCVGDSAPAQCTLPPSPFSEALPTPELGVDGRHWGGASASQPRAPASTPFPDSTQVVMTPVVANLTDDNGDGLINELDFPEIIFLTFCEPRAFNTNGVLRAIHGGGPDRGRDLFASCDKDTLWQQGDPTEGADAPACDCDAQPELDPTAGLAVADLNDDGSPEIVAVGEDNRLRLYDRLGRFVAESPVIEGGTRQNGAPAVANLDGAGLAEIVLGRTVATLREAPDGAGGTRLAFDRTFVGDAGDGTNGQGPISCVADLDEDGRQEVIAGATVYRLPAPVEDCSGPLDPAGEAQAYCDGRLVQRWSKGGGFCAVADVWGADPAAPPGPANPLDGVPEVVVVRSGRAEVYEGEQGTLLYSASLGPGNGGAPNVDDFDGDGFPEIGTATRGGYTMVDLQPADPTWCPAWPDAWPSRLFPETAEPANPNPPRSVPSGPCTRDADCDPAGTTYACNEAAGRCVCLHNGWTRVTQDDSSHVTGSSLFDFNGDGAVEVVYNDECFFRVYAGQDGEELFREPSESRTRIENPTIADVDNDGNAEIIFGTSTESTFCTTRNGGVFAAPDRDLYNPGLEVWGDDNDRWVSARRIYNQHAYHVTNVTEGGRVPAREPPAWRPLNGRLYNSYRSQPRSTASIAAPDLTIAALQVTSPNGCGPLGDEVDIVVRVRNEGDLRVGPGVWLGLHGEWTEPALDAPLGDGQGANLGAELTTSLEPGAETSLTLRYRAQDNTPGVLPDYVRAVLDEGDRQRECDETDNEARTDVQSANSGADLTLALSDPIGLCPKLAFEARVHNRGDRRAEAVVVTLYIGDPSAGGVALASATFPEPIEAGSAGSLTFVVPDFPDRPVAVYAVADPGDEIPECNDGNNQGHATADCSLFIQ